MIYHLSGKVLFGAYGTSLLCSTMIRSDGIRLYDLEAVQSHNSHIIPFYFSNTNSETPCLGSSKPNITLPPSDFTSVFLPYTANCPAFFSFSYCSFVGSCGSPIPFHTSKAL